MGYNSIFEDIKAENVDIFGIIEPFDLFPGEFALRMVLKDDSGKCKKYRIIFDSLTEFRTFKCNIDEIYNKFSKEERARLSENESFEKCCE